MSTKHSRRESGNDSQPKWRQSLLHNLTLRDTVQAVYFNDICEAHERILSENDRLHEELKELKVRNSEMLIQLERSKSMSEFNNNELLLKQKAAAESKLLELQNELIESMRKNGQTDQMFVDLTRQNKAQATTIAQLEESLAAANKERESLSLNLNLIQAKLNEETTSKHILEDALSQLHAEYTIKETELKTVNADYNALVARWLKMKQEEQEELNKSILIADEIQNLEKRKKLLEAANDNFAVVDSPKRPGSLTAPMSFVDSKIDAILAAGGESSVVPTSSRMSVKAHDGEICALAAANAGSLFLTGGVDKYLKLWDAATGTLRSTFSGCTQSVLTCAFSMDDSVVLGGGSDNKINVWSCQTGRLKYALTGHTGKVSTARFSADNVEIIVTGSHDRTIKLWDKGFCKWTLNTMSSCNDLAILDGSCTSVASGHVDGHLRVWDLRSRECTMDIGGIHSTQITSVALSSDFLSLLTYSRDNKLKLFDLRMMSKMEPNVLQTFEHADLRNGLNYSRASISPDRCVVAAGSHDGAVFLFDKNTGAFKKKLSKHATICSGVVWTGNGHHMVSTDRNGLASIWQ